MDWWLLSKKWSVILQHPRSEEKKRGKSSCNHGTCNLAHGHVMFWGQWHTWSQFVVPLKFNLPKFRVNCSKKIINMISLFLIYYILSYKLCYDSRHWIRSLNVSELEAPFLSFLGDYTFVNSKFLGSIYNINLTVLILSLPLLNHI